MASEATSASRFASKDAVDASLAAASSPRARDSVRDTSAPANKAAAFRVSIESEEKAALATEAATTMPLSSKARARFSETRSPALFSHPQQQAAPATPSCPRPYPIYVHKIVKTRSWCVPARLRPPTIRIRSNFFISPKTLGLHLAHVEGRHVRVIKFRPLTTSVDERE